MGATIAFSFAIIVYRQGKQIDKIMEGGVVGSGLLGCSMYLKERAVSPGEGHIALIVVLFSNLPRYVPFFPFEKMSFICLIRGNLG